MTPDVSVVIRTFNEAERLPETLRAVYAQRDVSPEVIVVDSGSTDRTREIAAEFPVRLIEIARAEFSYGRALNRGFAVATAPIVVALSAHALPFDRHWLRNLIRPFSDATVDGVVGKTLPHAACNPFDRRGLLRNYPTSPRQVFDGRVPGFSNANSAVRRAAWEEEPFDESLPYSEDVLWARRRLGRGRGIVYAPDAVVHHSHDETPHQLRRRFWGEARARELIDPRGDRYRRGALAWDVVAGTLYDWWELLRTRQSARWYAFAPRRRLAINAGRFAGSRGIELPAGSLVPRLLDRAWCRVLRLTGSLAGRLAPRVVVLTRKHPRPLHPKHLLDEHRDHFWYEEEIVGATRALDVGCNVGAHTNFLARHGAAVVGMDLDPVALGHARFVLGWEGARRAVVMQADAGAAFPFADNAFDRVLAFDVIEHLDDPDHLLREIGRVLAPGGLLLITAPHADTPWKRRLRAAGLPFFADVTHRLEFTHDGFVATLRRAGFEVVREEPVVADTPAAPWFDLLGAFHLGLYRRLAAGKRRRALAHPEESTGFRVVARRVEG